MLQSDVALLWRPEGMLLASQSGIALPLAQFKNKLEQISPLPLGRETATNSLKKWMQRHSAKLRAPTAADL